MTADKKKDSAEQIVRFRDAARALGCDEDKEHFEAQLGEIARHKPPALKPKNSKTNKPAK